MTDIVEQLRALARAEHDDLSVADEAADTIEQLRARVAELEGAVLAEREACAKLVESKDTYHSPPPSNAVSYPSMAFRFDVARAIRERTDGR